MPLYSKAFVFLCLSLSLSACVVGPDYERPESKALKVKEHPYLHAKAPIAKPQPMAKWWTRLGDPLMDRYVRQLLAYNLSLKESAERVIQAAESLNVTQGGYFPSVSVTGTGKRGFAPNAGGDRVYSTALSSDLTVSWQADVFGRVRRAAESGRALLEASQKDKEAMEHSLIAELMKKRVALATYARRVELAEENRDSQKKIYDLVKRRYDLGVKGTSLSDVYLAENNYKTMLASLSSYQRQMTEERYRLDVLLGQAPGTTKVDVKRFPILAPPRDVALCLPAMLLDRRPDLRASELRLVAANANIGVAIADLFPSISLGSALSFAGDGAGSFFTSSNMAGSLFTNLSMRLFEGGALRANIRVKESKARELMATYGKTVLEAVREVETALMSEEKLAKELQSKAEALSALKRAEQMSEARYIKGIETLRSYLEVQQKRAVAEQEWLTAQQEKWKARVNLYLALGGDWMHKKEGAVCSAPSHKG